MAEVNIYAKFFERRVLSLMKHGTGRRERLTFYLKLYTHLVVAPDQLKGRRGFDRIKIVADLTREASFQGEAHYLRYINTVARTVLANQKRIQRILANDYTADPLHAKTQLLIAQNICMMRILKLSA